MRNRFLTLALLFVFVPLPGTVMAAEPVPGGACTTANLIVETGGPETTGVRNLMKCNGTTWQQLTTWLANGQTGIGTSTPASLLDVAGEVRIGQTTGLACAAGTAGGLRYNSTSSCVQFCNGTSWNCIASTSCDNAPAYFVFTDQNSLGTSSLYSSNIIQITGMDAGCGAGVGISGSGSPQYRVCSDAACSTVTTNWTASNNTLTMQGQYIQVRASTAAAAGTTYTVTTAIGPVTSDWHITTTPTVCSTGAIGTVCADGSVYAGLSPDGNVPMYVTRCDYNQSWNGSTCINARQAITWNNGNTTGQVDTSLVNCGSVPACGVSGATNTTTLVATDSDSIVAGVQPHGVAAYCDALTLHSQTDWYLPSAPELNVMFTNAAAIGNFDVSGAGYWSSSEVSAAISWYQRFNNGAQGSGTKDSAVYYVRCARK